MTYIAYVLVVIAVFFAMEWVAWATHRYIMHGLLWFLHRDHHQPHEGKLEKNDWFAIIFSIPSIGSFLLGKLWSNPWLYCIGLGILLYGIAYFFVHDIIVHQRVRWFTRTRSRYVKQLRWAHKMHHKHLGKENGESFGFLFVEKKYRDKIERDEQLQQKNTGK
ncbi:sterol desaturase family protein [Olivibacter sitiensis]|uniref:sterol desaturase family protein n=1 Tax=Olivibacter sitiensis TaxID=376470 RepID=UPI000428D4E8|nr:sterol desaturase family protein [Olivibacter sitiensis]